MDENSVIIQQILDQDLLENRYLHQKDESDNWQMVSYRKGKKFSKLHPENYSMADVREAHVFLAIENDSEDRLKIIEYGDVVSAVEGSKRDAGDDSKVEENNTGSGIGVVKKNKPKKVKKPKVTVAMAAAKIDAGDLGAFLIDVTASYEAQEDIQLMRFADHFGRAFAPVTLSQFPWVKIFKEYTLSKLIDIPLSHISEEVYSTSVDWISQRSLKALEAFVLWSLDNILTDFKIHHEAAKGSKKVVHQTPSKSLVAVFAVLGITLRGKPDVSMVLLPLMKENSQYQGQDKLPVIVWAIAQVSQGDAAVGLYLWIRILLPMLADKSNCNPQSRDLILQLVERILSSPNARAVGAVKNGERLVPPAALDSLMRFTFSNSKARVTAASRFIAVYSSLKKIALAGSPSSKAIKQVAQELLNYAINATGEGVSDLSKEASDVFIWCLYRNPDCYKQWDVLYLDNLEASLAVLKKLSDGWKVHSGKRLTTDPVMDTLQNLRQKNRKALSKSDTAARDAYLIKEADKYCKTLLRKESKGCGFLKSMIVVTVVLAVGVAAISQNIDEWDLNKLTAVFSQP